MANDNTAVFALILVGIVAVIGLFALRPMSGYYAVSANTTGGLLNITIGTALSITLIDNLVDFGTGYVNSGDAYAIVDSNDTASGTAGNWTSTADGAGGWPGASTDYMTLENNGNVDAKVNISASANAATFIGGTSPAQNYAGADNEAGSCVAGLQSAYTALTTSQKVLCTNLTYGAANDAVDIMYKLTIPSDATPSAKSNTITFSAVAA
jgi:hypothetical protein